MNSRLTIRRPGRAAAAVGAAVAVSATALMALVAGTASAEVPGRCVDNVKVREQPDINSPVVTVCETGTAVQVAETRNGFVHLTDLGGWSAQEYVSVNGAAPAAPVARQAPAAPAAPAGRGAPAQTDAPAAPADPASADSSADGTGSTGSAGSADGTGSAGSADGTGSADSAGTTPSSQPTQRTFPRRTPAPAEPTQEEEAAPAAESPLSGLLP